MDVSVNLWELLPSVIFFITVVVIIVAVYMAYKKISGKVRAFSKTFFGTSNLIEGWNRQADVLAETPKSVSSMTRLMEPQIMRDFPEFSWDEFRSKAENMLTSALLAISAANTGLLTEASADVKRQVENIIRDNEAAGIGETYSDIEIHQTEIANYTRDKGKCIITIQSAVGYLHYKMSKGRLLEGDKNRKTQTKYNMELVYIQDSDLAEYDNAMGTTCPNCGAPIKNLGAKFCEYCGTGITPINIKVWSLHKFYEVDYNRN